MTKKVQLLDNQIKLLESLPEQGMGYQIVDIELQNGKKLIERVIFNSTYLKLSDEEVVDPLQIKSIKLHEQRSSQ